MAVESRSLDGAPPSAILSDTDLRGFDALSPSEQEFIWLRDGRILYTVAEPDISGNTCNLWQIPVDTHTGAPLAKPERLTNWAGFCITGLSQTSDGKRLVFSRQTTQVSLHGASFDPRKLQLGVPNRLTLTEDWSLPIGWMPGSKVVLMLSNREGSWGFYKQGQHGAAAEAILTGIKTKPDWASISPDRRWILYYIRDFSDPITPAHIMRVPLSGGPPEDIGDAQLKAMNCPSSVASMCVVSEITPDNREVIFSAWEPETGRGKELARVQDEHADNLRWALSPDGTRIAISDGSNSFAIVSLNDQTVQHVDVKGDAYPRSWTWAADGRGLFVSTAVQQGAQLSYCDLRGGLHTLWQVKGQKVLLIASPAPNGHSIAIAASAESTNMWMMENF